MPTAVDTTALQAALTGLAEQVAAASFSAPAPGDLGAARRRRLAWHLDDYLLPRVRDLEAPLVCILLGCGIPTTAWYSLARRFSISRSRPSTRTPSCT